jgi:hypothetical protein
MPSIFSSVCLIPTANLHKIENDLGEGVPMIEQDNNNSERYQQSGIKAGRQGKEPRKIN